MVEHPARLLDSWGQPQTLSNTMPLLTAPDDLLTLCTVRWCALYPYGKYSTDSNSSLKGHPPFCSAIESTTDSWFDPQSYAPAP